MRAVTLDFYNTLIYHRAGMGRGRSYQNYLSAAGLASDPWEHQVLYDVFEYYAAAYRPTLTEGARLSFWTEFTRRLFERTGVRASTPIDYAAHAPAIRDLMGPTAFALFDDSLDVLIVSDWQKGLAHFCHELGLSSFFDVIVASAEVGCEKPDPRLFEAARVQLNVPAEEILHVGDSAVDVQGAHAAGFAAALLVRSADPSPETDAPVIRSLRELPSLL
jgi:HAD superfamily hydrolase (TIGR01549 family)